MSIRFREVLEEQLRQMENASTVDDVLSLCPAGCDDHVRPGQWCERCSEYRGIGDGAFMGDGDDMLGALYAASWRAVDYRASYHWCLKAPDGSMLTYVEGDLYRGNSMPSARD